MQLSSALFGLSQKNKKNPPRKKFLIFREMELLAVILKIFSIFWEMKPFSPSSKNKKNPP